jgi:hypothetical protein
MIEVEFTPVSLLLIFAFVFRFRFVFALILLIIGLTQVRIDGVCGSTVKERSGIVRALPPQVMNVSAVVVMAGPGQQAQQRDRPELLLCVGGVLRGTAQYRGGSEGQSCYQWQRTTQSPAGEGGVVPAAGSPWTGIEGAIRQGYTVTGTDKGCCLRFGLLPVNVDGVAGDWAFSAPTSVVLD